MTFHNFHATSFFKLSSFSEKAPQNTPEALIYGCCQLGSAKWPHRFNCQHVTNRDPFFSNYNGCIASRISFTLCAFLAIVTLNENGRDKAWTFASNVNSAFSLTLKLLSPSTLFPLFFVSAFLFFFFPFYNKNKTIEICARCVLLLDEIDIHVNMRRESKKKAGKGFRFFRNTEKLVQILIYLTLILFRVTCCMILWTYKRFMLDVTCVHIALCLPFTVCFNLHPQQKLFED